jgi:ribosomal-protein-alanine N-acetyltransferase
VFELQRLRPDHESALLDFELANRAYFAQSISDRGDEFFEEFTERHRELLAEQGAGVGAFYVLVDDDETVVGRFNLYDFSDSTAEVGYRVAQRVSGRGVATTALRDLCRIARKDFGMWTLKATTSNENVASQRVLAKSGFVAVGPTLIDGREGQIYELVLADI